MSPEGTVHALPGQPRAICIAHSLASGSESLDRTLAGHQAPSVAFSHDAPEPHQVLGGWPDAGDGSKLWGQALHSISDFLFTSWATQSKLPRLSLCLRLPISKWS